MPRNPNKIDYPGGLPDSFESFLVIEAPPAPGETNNTTSVKSCSWS